MIPGAVCLMTLLAVSSTLAAPAGLLQEYQEVPQKRAALVLDRLLIALQHALHEDARAHHPALAGDGPRTAPLRVPPLYGTDMRALQRRGQAGTGRGRVLRCYFNAITCF